MSFNQQTTIDALRALERGERELFDQEIKRMREESVEFLEKLLQLKDQGGMKLGLALVALVQMNAPLAMQLLLTLIEREAERRAGEKNSEMGVSE